MVANQVPELHPRPHVTPVAACVADGSAVQFVLLEDANAPDTGQHSRLYRDPCAILRFTLDADWQTLSENKYAVWQQKLQYLLDQAEDYLARGWYAVLICHYELCGLLHEVPIHTSSEPLLELQFYQQYQSLDAQQVNDFLHSQNLDPQHPAGVMNLQPSIDQTQFERACAQLKNYLLHGHSYQINFTYRLFFKNYGSPIALYQRLRARQPVSFSALIRTQHGWVLSFSPELFVRRQGPTLSAKPMKGTAPRSGQADACEATALGMSEKERTENVIIVDLLRNDLGRISQTGSVTVAKLFEVEAHPTVWQMTSSIASESQIGLKLYQLLQALFPCGSVTGAPKRRSLEIIHELEPHPRRLYCGALGWLDPPVQPAEPLGNFCLSVPIRTLLLDGHGNGELGVGAGITYASSAAQEYAECQTKAKFLTQLSPAFNLFETFALNATGYVRLPAHLQRLRDSAKKFGFIYCEEKIYTALARYQTEFTFTEGTTNTSIVYRVRLSLTPHGEINLSATPLSPIVAPVKLMWAETGCFSDDVLLRHKTTYRAVYDAAWQTAQACGYFDAILCNERGQVTEGGRSNLFVKINQQWFTPAISCGLLPGVMRAELIQQLQAQEKILYPDDVKQAQEWRVCNSLRGALVAFF